VGQSQEAGEESGEITCSVPSYGVVCALRRFWINAKLSDYLIPTIMKGSQARPVASNAFAKGHIGESTNACNLGCAQADTETAWFGQF
jgi:hypothetical protein